LTFDRRNSKNYFYTQNIQISILTDLPKIYGNSFRFKQVLQNLIQNSITHSDKEKGLIELGATESENDFQFFIRDNGVGIAEAYHDKILKSSRN
jgi:light-regulated signal transduction histidine kinase (bacteriophytochrome)